MSGSLCVATLNIWNRFGDWPARLPVLRQQLQAISPDLLGLQEVIFEQPIDLSQPISVGQADEIADGLGYHVAYGDALVLGEDDTTRYVFGNALLSRYPIEHAETVVLPQGPDPSERRSVLCTRVATPGLPVGVYVTHLNWKLDESNVRLRQVQALDFLIAAREPRDGTRLPALLLGDFNAEPESDEMRYLTGLATASGHSTYFADVWRYRHDDAGRPLPGFTFDPANRNAALTREFARRIDYILVHGGPDDEGRFHPQTPRLAFDQGVAGPDGPVFPSDHFGVVSELSLGEQPG
jgi:endonuclease/exonuclease/phosphatase family metal-dependent hydrolase